MLDEKWTLLALVALATAVLILPIVRFYFVGWVAKRGDIMDGQSECARREYFQMFCRFATDKPRNFDEMYERFYGRHLFLWPTLLLVCVFAVLALVTIGSIPGLDTTLTQLGFPHLDLKGQAAVAGAFMWVVNDFTWRARRLDFSPADIQWSVLRLSIAIPMGYSIAAIVPAGQTFVAFALGAFPLADIMTILRRLATDRLGFAPSERESQDDIVKLQGINRSILERLSNEDIETITQIAYCDPIRLAMRSNLSFNFITDCMNQALAWVYLEGELIKVRRFGLKGAVEIKHLVDAMDPAPSQDPDPVKRAEEDARNAKAQPIAVATFNAAAKELNQPPETLMTAFKEIVDDPFTTYLYTIWD